MRQRKIDLIRVMMWHMYYEKHKPKKSLTESAIAYRERLSRFDTKEWPDLLSGAHYFFKEEFLKKFPNLFYDEDDADNFLEKYGNIREKLDLALPKKGIVRKFLVYLPFDV